MLKNYILILIMFVVMPSTINNKISLIEQFDEDEDDYFSEMILNEELSSDNEHDKILEIIDA